MILAWLLPATAAALELEVSGEAEHWRFPVPDALYAAGLQGDFSDLLILDQDGRKLDFAGCTIFTSAQQRQTAKVLGVAEIGRPELTPDGSVTITRPPGAPANGPIASLIIDLRDSAGAVHSLSGVPPVQRLRESPNLRQWGPAIPFEQNGAELSFPARPLHFLRLELVQPIDAAPARVEIAQQSVAERPEPHWFTPDAHSEGRYRNPRSLPIFAARLRNASPAQGWTLDSRQADWDAWKPRGTITAGAPDGTLRFSGVTDPQWRLKPASAGELQLAHARHELRIPEVGGTGPLRLVLQNTSRRRPALSCRATESLAVSVPAQISVRSDTAAPEPAGPTNLRSRFLLLAGIAVLTGLLVRRWWRRRQ